MSRDSRLDALLHGSRGDGQQAHRRARGRRTAVSDTAVCFIHGVDETYTDGLSYKACGECWHVWQTPAAFIADLAKWGLPIPPLDQVYSCPLCTHDF